MKKILSAVLPALVFLACKKQADPSDPEQPDVSLVRPFNKLYGGTNAEGFVKGMRLGDGGYMLAGYTNSSDDDVATGLGYNDIWLVKLDTAGKIVWEKTYGGSSDDFVSGLVASPDGGFIVSASTQSPEITPGGIRPWLFKIDKAGAIVWQATFTDHRAARITSIQSVTGGGYIGCGFDGVSGIDLGLWIFRFDENGQVLWQKNYGDSTVLAADIDETPDGDFVVSGTVQDASGSDDLLGIKVDSKGELKWKKSFGGTGSDEGYSVLATSDGGAIIGGLAWSVDGDASSSHGNADLFLVKVDADGGKQWVKLIGGSDFEQMHADGMIETPEKHYLVASYSASSDGDRAGTHDYLTAWIDELDEQGNLVKKNLYGGSNSDYFYSLVPLNEQFGLALGSTLSTNGSPSTNHGNFDAWAFTFELK